MNNSIEYSGITTKPSDLVSQDGELSVALNLVNEQGLKPITTPKTILSVDPPERVLFIHTTPGFKRFIVYNPETGQIRAIDESGGRFPIDSDIRGITRFSSVGNILLAFRQNDIHYYFFREGRYIPVGTHLPDIKLNFGLIGHPELYSRLHSSPEDKSSGYNGVLRHEFEVPLGRKKVWAHTPFGSGYDADYKDGVTSRSNQALFNNAVFGVLNKYVNDAATYPGRFVFPFFVRYALRLFDNSLVCHSAPILMSPSTRGPVVFTPKTEYQWLVAGSDDTHSVKPGRDDLYYYRSFDLDCFGVPSELDYQFLGFSAAELEPWRDLISSLDIFVTPPIYPYKADGDIPCPFRWADGSKNQFIGRLERSEYEKSGWPRALPFNQAERPMLDNSYMAFPFDALMMAECQVYSEQKHLDPAQNESHPITPWGTVATATDGNIPTVPMPAKNEAEIKQAFRNTAFFKLASIDFDDLLAELRDTSTVRHKVKVEPGFLQALEQQEQLPNDYQSHDSFSAEVSYPYNSRMNLASVTRTLFNGFTPDTMFALVNARLVDQGNQQLFSIDNTHHDLVIETIFKDQGNSYSLFAHSSIPLISFFSTATPDEPLSYFNYLFYPDTAATRMVLYEDGTPKTNLKLEAHPFLNGAYHHIPYDTPHPVDSQSSIITTRKPLPPGASALYTVPQRIRYANKIYTSEVFNPFRFPLNNINSVGSGRILGLASAAIPLSQGQFGYSPLYCFSTDGIWALTTTETGGWASIQPLAQDVCTDPESITPLDNAIVFSSNRGLMLLAGNSTQPISDPIREPDYLNLTTLPEIDKIMLAASPDFTMEELNIIPFRIYLRDARPFYDYPHQRLILFNPGRTYAYIYSFQSRMWTMMRSDLHNALNSYPDALAVSDDGKILDFGAFSETALPGLMITRPFKMGDSTVLKTLHNVFQRGVFGRGHVQQALYGSNDFEHWFYVKSSNDMYLRRFGGTPYKAYRLAVITHLLPTETLAGCTTDAEAKYIDKMR